ncbi:MAG TPA: NUDIX hydrolase [Candidatus Saccharimonadales bacterium]|nr:NUDIX hydrolase [Candidatus Saccharimonadales bacterium]
MAITPFTTEEKANWHNNLPAKPCGAAMICVNKENKMLAVKASYKDHWSVPGGVVDEGESPQKAALRELQEEVNISLVSSQIKFVDVVYHHPQDDRKDFVHFLFMATNVNATATPDMHEIVEAKWVSPKEFRELCRGAPHLIRAADIVDGLNPQQYLENTRSLTGK